MRNAFESTLQTDALLRQIHWVKTTVRDNESIAESDDKKYWQNNFVVE